MFQEIIKFLFINLLVFVWMRYFCRKLTVAALVAFVLSIAIYLLLFFISKKKTNKENLKLKEKEEAENMFFSLATSESSLDFFEKLALKRHENVQKHKDFISITYDDSSAKTLLYFCDEMQGLSVGTFMKIYKKIKKENATKIVICCKEIADKQLSTFAANFKEKFLVFDQYETYKRLYKFYNCFPKVTISYSKDKKMVLKDFVAYSFNKKRTKGYFFSAFILVLSGLFVRASLYYCIVASILVVFAIISQFNPYFNAKSTDEVL